MKGVAHGSRSGSAMPAVVPAAVPASRPEPVVLEAMVSVESTEGLGAEGSRHPALAAFDAATAVAARHRLAAELVAPASSRGASAAPVAQRSADVVRQTVAFLRERGMVKLLAPEQHDSHLNAEFNAQLVEGALEGGKVHWWREASQNDRANIAADAADPAALKARLSVHAAAAEPRQLMYAHCSHLNRALDHPDAVAHPVFFEDDTKLPLSPFFSDAREFSMFSGGAAHVLAEYVNGRFTHWPHNGMPQQIPPPMQSPPLSRETVADSYSALARAQKHGPAAMAAHHELFTVKVDGKPLVDRDQLVAYLRIKGWAVLVVPFSDTVRAPVTTHAYFFLPPALVEAGEALRARFDGEGARLLRPVTPAS
jgi:hypothetical protein